MYATLYERVMLKEICKTVAVLFLNGEIESFPLVLETVVHGINTTYSELILSRQ